jgi:hypothetical protein
LKINKTFTKEPRKKNRNQNNKDLIEMNKIWQIEIERLN